MYQLLHTFSEATCVECAKTTTIHDQTGLCQPCYEEIIEGES